MFPLIWVGAALAAAFLSGCSRKAEEPAPKPPPVDPQLPFRPRPSEEPKSPTRMPPAIKPAEFETTPPKRMTEAELREMAEGLKKCLKVQQRYGLNCPPPQELPPGCICQEVDLPPELDPNYPQKVRNLLIPPPEPETLPNI